MRNDMSIQGVTPVTATSEQLPDSRNPRSSESGSSPASAPPPIYANPSLRLDASLGLVVIEFRDSGGSVADTIPTQRQLRAYKQHALTGTPAKLTGVPEPPGVSTPGGSRAPPVSADTVVAPGERAVASPGVPGPAAQGPRPHLPQDSST